MLIISSRLRSVICDGVCLRARGAGQVDVAHWRQELFLACRRAQVPARSVLRRLWRAEVGGSGRGFRDKLGLRDARGRCAHHLIYRMIG